MKSVFFLALSILLAFSVQAEYRIATVDVNRVLNESKESQAGKKTIDELSQSAKKKIDAEKTSLQKLEAELKKKGVKEDSAEAEQFRVKAREFSRIVKDNEEEVRSKFLKINRDLTDKAVKRIEAYAKSENIDIILDKSAQQRGPVLFGNPAVDITDSVLKSING